MKRAVVAGANLEHARLDEADMSDVLRGPAPVIYIDDRPLDDILAAHEAYCDSNGRDGAVTSLPGVDFRPVRSLQGRRLTALIAPRAIFFGLDLRGAQLQGADLTGCDFRGADLREADLRGARLFEADVARADLRGAQLGPLTIAPGRHVRTDFTRASLRAADLRGAHAQRARFLECNLDHARLEGCNMLNAELEV
jgi:uncharacterized protein YjbI with pentapeptide repeats